MTRELRYRWQVRQEICPSGQRTTCHFAPLATGQKALPRGDTEEHEAAIDWESLWIDLGGEG
jgi:hypothetical protein